MLTIRALTPELWPALDDLFASGGPCRRCWCMYWRIGAEYRRRPAEENRAAFQQIVSQEPSPGLLAFDGALPVGWCQLTPRSALPRLEREWRLKRLDQAPVWSISCFYVRIGHRRKGVTSALIAAALQTAKAAGAEAVEAYPLDAAETPSASFTGYVTTFLRAGFREAGRHVAARPILRYELENRKEENWPPIHAEQRR